jgi:Protein of unknown function (DUF3795)
MREITENAGLVAYCGLYCGACGAYLKERCQGCHENEKASWCKIRGCCKDKNIASCAECRDFSNARDCKKFNNLMSKVFGVLFRSDRTACIRQIQAIGVQGHAKKMAGMKMQAIKR